ncbi:MAG: serine/threonine protein kinase [Phycisphaeraceae bacterium]|nr:MAG: serine/threonine protein kinase [Phycisphaeraceae bacterium]
MSPRDGASHGGEGSTATGGGAQSPWRRAREIFESLIDLPEGSRDAALAAQCGEDEGLAARVRRLLDADRGTGGFLEKPAVDAVVSASAMVGRTIGRYRIVGLVGTGGMGRVYEAEQDYPTRRVALKLLGTLGSSEAVRRFNYEIRALARLRHPGIAPIYDAGVHEDEATGARVPYFAMELIAGGAPITEHAWGRGLTTKERCDLIARVCEAVHHAHQRGVIHRDLKPGNIIVDAQGVPRVIDFGVAREAEVDAGSGGGVTSAGQMVGTLSYMSPEQCGSSGGEVDVRTDVYSLGVVLFEVLSGHLPYEVSSMPPHEAARVIRDRAPTRLRAEGLRPGSDAEVVARKALEKEPDRRYQSALEMAEDLRRVVAGRAITARPPSAWYQARVFVRRNRTLVASIAAVVLSLVGAVVGTTVALMRARDAERSAQIEARRSGRIADFFKGAFRSANPRAMVEDESVAKPPLERWLEEGRGWGRIDRAGEGARVKDVLALAGSKLGETFPEDPLLRADLGFEIAMVLLSLGENDAGRGVLEECLRLRRLNLPPDHPDLARALAGLATQRSIEGDHGQAMRHHLEAHAICSASLGELHAVTLALNRAAALQMIHFSERRARAVDRMRASEVQVSRWYGPDSIEAWTARYALAEVLMWTGAPDEAEGLARAAVGALTAILGDRHIATTEAKRILSWVLEVREDGLEECERLRREQLMFFESVLGLGSADAYEARSLLYQVLARRGDWAGAAEVSRAQAEYAERTMGYDSYYTVKAKGRLARVLTQMGEGLEEAEALAEEVVRDNDRRTHPAEGWAAYHAGILASARRQLGREGDAVRILRERISAREAAGQSSGWVDGYLWWQLGEALYAMNDAAGAASAARSALMHAGTLDAMHPIRRGAEAFAAKLVPAAPDP